MKTIKLLALFLLFGFYASAQGTYLEFGATVLDANGNPVANHPVTVVDSSNSLLGGSVTTYLTNASGWFQDTILSGTAGTLYMITTDSCQTYSVDTLYTGNTTWLTFTHTFNLCNGASSSCNFAINATGPTATGIYNFSTTYVSNPASLLVWDFGDGTTSGGTNPTHTYAAPGTYIYCLTADNCPVVCDTVVVSSIASCDATFTVQDSGLFVEILPVAVGTTGHLEFFWGDGTYDTTNAANLPFTPYNHTYATPGTYTICVFHNQYANGNLICSDSTCATITVSASNPPVCSASYIVDTVNSQNGTVVLWNNTTVTNATVLMNIQFMWDFGDGTTSTQQFPMHQYANPGLYSVCLTVSASDPVNGTLCSSTYCDSLGMDANGNLIYKGAATGFILTVLDPNSIGLEENVLNELTFFPNPVKDVLSITIPEGVAGQADYQLYSVSGQAVLAEKVSGNNLSTKLSVSDLPAGLYILNVSLNAESKQFKIIKQ